MKVRIGFISLKEKAIRGFCERCNEHNEKDIYSLAGRLSVFVDLCSIQLVSHVIMTRPEKDPEEII